MRNYIKKLSVALIVSVLIILQFMPMTAYAADLKVTASSNSINVGDKVTVTITYSGTNLYGAQANVSLEPSKLKFTSDFRGVINVFDLNKPLTNITEKVTLEAQEPGEAKITVTTIVFMDYEKNSLINNENKSKTIKITVKEKPEPTPTPTPTPTPSPKPSDPPKTSAPPTSKPTSKPTQKPTSTPKATSTPKPTSTPASMPTPSIEPTPSPTPEVVNNPLDDAIKLEIHGKDLYMWKDLSSVELPNGFGLGSITYDGEKVEAMMDIENKLILVYLTDEKGENGDLYYYDSTTGLVFPYANIETNLSYIILQPGVNVEIPQGYKETTYIINGKTVKAWVLESGEEIGFYLVYAMDSKGNRGFYTYDSSEGTLQRFTERVVTIEVQATDEPEVVDAISDEIDEEQKQGISQRYGQIIKISIIVLAVIALSLIAILAIDNRKRKSNKHSKK
jgi:hypothetical protein